MRINVQGIVTHFAMITIFSLSINTYKTNALDDRCLSEAAAYNLVNLGLDHLEYPLSLIWIFMKTVTTSRTLVSHFQGAFL